MDARKNSGANHRKKSHRFSRTIDRSTPFLAKQIKDRGNQGAGVSDTDPENEIRNVPGPTDRNLVSPCADAGRNQVSNTKKPETCRACRDSKRYPPPSRSRLLHNTGYPLRQPVKVAPVQHKRDTPNLAFRFLNGWLWCCCSVHTYSANPQRRAVRAACGNSKSKIETREVIYSGILSTALATPMSFASGIFGFGLRIRAW